MGGDGIGQQAALGERGHQVMQVGETEEQVHLGHLGLQLLAVALDQAPHRHHRLHRPGGLEPRGLEDGVDRLLLGGVDEAAGVDQDDVGGREVGRDHGAVAHERPHQALGIDGGLVAPERDDAELHPR
jgi:hypothetical protein